jgi:hypothetical protein
LTAAAIAALLMGSAGWVADRLLWPTTSDGGECFLLDADRCRALPHTYALDMAGPRVELPSVTEVVESGSQPGLFLNLGSEHALLRAYEPFALPADWGESAPLTPKWRQKLEELGFVQVDTSRQVRWPDRYFGTVVEGRDSRGRALLYVPRVAQ